MTTEKTGQERTEDCARADRMLREAEEIEYEVLSDEDAVWLFDHLDGCSQCGGPLESLGKPSPMSAGLVIALIMHGADRGCRMFKSLGIEARSGVKLSLESWEWYFEHEEECEECGYDINEVVELLKVGEEDCSGLLEGLLIQDGLSID